MGLKFEIELDREDDGRWIAEITALPGVLNYGKTKKEAVAKIKALALQATHLGKDAVKLSV